MEDRLTERITDVYLITMLLIFPLFFGFSGYAEITISKYIFFLAATGLWLAALIVAAALRRLRLPPRSPVLLAAGVYAGICLLSWLFSGDLGRSFVGAGRYDGLLTSLAYLLCFSGVCAFSRPKRLHVRAFALAVSLCLLLSLFQLGGGNPLRLYPRDLSFFDHGVRYSGVYLGTIGNTNILDAVLCLALPVFGGLYIAGGQRELLVPLVLAAPVLVKAVGDGGKLAFLLLLLFSPILLLTDLMRIRRALRLAALLLAAAALSLWWQPSPGAPLRFACAPAVGWLMLAGAVCCALSYVPLPASFSPAPRTLRTVFAALAGAGVLAGLAAVLCFHGSSGTLYEFNRLLRGQAEDSFGSSRIRIWRACLALVPARPLLGYGPGMLAAHLNIAFSRFVPETGETLRSYADNAHSVYLAALVNTGALGLAALLAQLALAGKCAAKRLRDPLRLSLALGAGCAAVHGLFGLGLCLSQPLFWIALGMLCAPDMEKP